MMRECHNHVMHDAVRGVKVKVVTRSNIRVTFAAGGGIPRVSVVRLFYKSLLLPSEAIDLFFYC